MTPLDDERLDLSPLDPTRDPVRLSALARAIAAQAGERAQPDPWAALWRLWRPSLALAATCALAAWGPLLWPRGPSTSEAEVADPASAVLEWARAGAPDSAAEVLRSLGRER